MAGFLGSLFSKGKYEKEVKALQEKAAQEPKNIHLLVRIGDLREKMGQRAEALAAYRNASEQYAQNGFLIQAIAVNKVILRLDESQSKIHEQLASLYARQGMIQEVGGESKAVEMTPETSKKMDLPVIPLFSDLTKDELSKVMEKIQARKFSKGKPICNQGDPGDSIFIISHGKVGIFQQRDGQKISLNELHPGEFFGEFGFFADSRRQATVEALEDTEVLEITKQDLQEIMKDFPGVIDVLFKFYKERVLDTLLATSSIFQTLSPEERKKILKKFTLEEIPAGTTLIQEGDPGDSLFIIKKGEVEVFTSDAQGGKVSLAKLNEGDFFGEISFLTGRTRTASVKALQPTQVVRLAKNDFDPISATHPEIMNVLKDAVQIRLESKLKALGIFKFRISKGGMV